MQCPKLSDDELWRAIAHNTDTLSALLLDELNRDDSEINPCTRAAAASKPREADTEKRSAMTILLACLSRCATIPAVIRYAAAAALISGLIVGADYGYGPYEYDYTAAPLYDYAGPTSPAPVHTAPPGYGPLVYTPQVYAPTSTTSLTLMFFSALFMGGASLPVAQDWPAAGGQPLVAGAAASKPAAAGSTTSVPARTAQHHGTPHDRIFMMLVKAPIKAQIDAR